MRNHWFGPREFHPAQQDSNFAQFVERENFFAHFAAASNADKVPSAALCFCLRFPARSPRPVLPLTLASRAFEQAAAKASGHPTVPHAPAEGAGRRGVGAIRQVGRGYDTRLLLQD